MVCGIPIQIGKPPRCVVRARKRWVCSVCAGLQGRAGLLDHHAPVDLRRFPPFQGESDSTDRVQTCIVFITATLRARYWSYCGIGLRVPGVYPSRIAGSLRLSSRLAASSGNLPSDVCRYRRVRGPLITQAALLKLTGVFRPSHWRYRSNRVGHQVRRTTPVLLQLGDLSVSDLANRY